MKRGEQIRVGIGGLAFGGDAVGRAPDGRVVFVAGAVPGDVVDVEVEEVKRGHVRGRLVRLVEAGAERVEPRCGLVGRCGGCQWQEASRAAQRRAKQEIVTRALARLGAVVAPLVAPTEDYGYRTRARLHAAGGALGFQERRSHRLVDVPACPLLAPPLAAALAALRTALAAHLPDGAEVALLGGRAGVHVSLGGVRGARVVLERAPALLGQAGILGVIVDGRTFGAEAIDTAEEGDPPFLAAADGFAQASAAGNRALRRIVLAEAVALLPGGFPRASIEGDLRGRLLELHAGDGNFTRDLAPLAGELVAVEAASRAAARLRRNVQDAHVEVRGVPAEREALRLADAGERFDLVLLDPPRIGARELVPALARLTDRVLYVSCDPMTLARDAAELGALGLAPGRATPVDLMPHTTHVETVLVLERQPRA